MRIKEYDSKIKRWYFEIKEEEKILKKLEAELYNPMFKVRKQLDYNFYYELENKVFEKRERIEWMKHILIVIQNHVISPKARKSNNLQDLYSRTNNSYYD